MTMEHRMHVGDDEELRWGLVRWDKDKEKQGQVP